MRAISSYRGNRPTNTQTVVITIHCAAASMQCKDHLSQAETTNSQLYAGRMPFPSPTQLCQQH